MEPGQIQTLTMYPEKRVGEPVEGNYAMSIALLGQHLDELPVNSEVEARVGSRCVRNLLV